MTRGRLTPDTVTLHVPFRIVKRGGRKEMQLPAGTLPQRKTDNTLIKALARAFRWKRMLDSGGFATNRKIRPQPDRENAFARASGGGGGIRTHGGVAPTTVFETAPFDRSGTPPAAAASKAATGG